MFLKYPHGQANRTRPLRLRRRRGQSHRGNVRRNLTVGRQDTQAAGMPDRIDHRRRPGRIILNPYRGNSSRGFARALTHRVAGFLLSALRAVTKGVTPPRGRKGYRCSTSRRRAEWTSRGLAGTLTESNQSLSLQLPIRGVWGALGGVGIKQRSRRFDGRGPANRERPRPGKI